MASFAELLTTYGPWAVLIGTLVEGETVVVLAGFAAFQGFLDPAVVAGCALAGTLIGDQACFYIGRRHADHPWVRRVRARRAFVRALRLIERHATKFILTLRFVYGLRSISLIALGVSGVPYRKFLVLDSLIAAVWAIAFTAAGFVFGRTATAFVGEMHAFEQQILAGLAIVVALLAGHHLIRRLGRH